MNFNAPSASVCINYRGKRKPAVPDLISEAARKRKARIINSQSEFGPPQQTPNLVRFIDR